MGPYSVFPVFALTIGFILLACYCLVRAVLEMYKHDCHHYCKCHKHERDGLGLTVDAVVGNHTQGGVTMATPITFVDVEKVLLSIAPKDEDGHVVANGPYTWTSSDETVVTLVVSADGLSADAISGQPGVAVVTVTDGVLSDAIECTIVHGPPLSLNLSAGVPVHE